MKECEESSSNRWGIPKRLWKSRGTRIRVRAVVEEYSPSSKRNNSSTESEASDEAKTDSENPVGPSPNGLGNKKGEAITVQDFSYYWWEKQLDRGCESDSICLWFTSPQQQTATKMMDQSSTTRSQFLQHNITSRLHEEIEVTETHHVKVRLPPTHPKISSAPFQELFVPTLDLTNSVSELTLRSCVVEPAQHRRMAYYAVGQQPHRNKSVHGNRRCYFTGKLILHQPFYAGTLLQGLRTLVVFCLPSALELGMGQVLPQRSGLSSSLSRISGDEELSVEQDLDVHWNVKKDHLFSILPEASPSLLETMKTMYPIPFETLPMQIRDPRCWKLYSKFCFFSGLPIARDELHYKVKDVIADIVYGEEVALSHEVMKACSEAPELLALPSKIVLAYLQQHYPQQCAKLEERVFRRSSWERVESE